MIIDETAASHFGKHCGILRAYQRKINGTQWIYTDIGGLCNYVTRTICLANGHVLFQGYRYIVFVL